MTANETVELLFRCKMEGQAEVDGLAASVRGVSGATALASDGLASLEKSITALTAAVTENTAAVAGMEGGFDRAGAGATRLAGGARAATAELRLLEGAMPIRAAGQFLSQIEGLAPILNAAFPIFGAIALVGVLDQIIEKVQKWVSAHDPLTKAQNESLSLLKESTKEYDRLREKLHALTLDEYERAHGRNARLLLEASEHDTKAQGPDAHNIARLENYARVLREVSAFKVDQPMAMGSGDPTMAMAARTPVGGTQLTERQASLLKAAGMEGQLMGDDKAVNPFEGIQAGQTLGQHQIDAARLLLQQGIAPELETARMAQKVEGKTSDDDRAKVAADEKKKADEAAAKRTRELQEAEKQAAAYLREAQNFELTGLAKINAVYHEKLQLLGKTKKAIDDINAAYAIEVGRELNHIQANNRKQLGAYLDQTERDEEKADKFGAKQFAANLKKQIEQDKKDIESGLKVLQASDDSDADGVRRALGSTVKANSVAVRSGRMTGTGAAESDYDARIAAANEIFRIETQHLSLIDDKDKREEKLAQARKKYADEVYRAEEDYENQLQTLREKDLDKYRSMAGSIFDALHGHTINQWFKGFALNQGKQVFENAATPILQNAGHMLGGMIPNVGPLGTLLHGTIFDNANADPGKETAQHTKDTAEQVKGLRGDLKGILTGNPNPDAPVTPGGAASSLPNPHSIFSNPLGIFGSDISGWTGSDISGWTGSGVGLGTSSSTNPAMSLFNSSNGSGFSQFFAGLGAGGNNPLQAIFTGQAHGDGWGANLTGGQQAGVAVATGAMLAGAGLSIASGISQGGVGGYGKAAASGLGVVAALDPEPISKTILGSVAAITGMVTSMFGTGPQQRSKDLFNELSSNQYLAPTALNVMQGMNGTYEDFDVRGNLRTSTMSAVPTVAEPYITSRVVNGQRTYYDAPGNVTAPYSGGATGNGVAPVAGTPIVNIYGDVHAMDSASFHDFIRRPANSNAVGESLADHLQRQDGRASSEIRKANGN